MLAEKRRWLHCLKNTTSLKIGMHNVTVQNIVFDLVSHL